MAIKVVTLECFFPELKGPACHQTGRGRGSSVRVAFAAAGRNLFKQPKLKAKRFTMLKAVISIGTEAEMPVESQSKDGIGEY